MNHYAIQTQELTKCFGQKRALNALNLNIPKAGVNALVGANGAGKSTLFRILLGLMAPSSGSATILGQDSNKLSGEHRSRIGFVNEEHTLPEWLKVGEILHMHKHLYPKWHQQSYDDVIGHFNVSSNQKISQLSRGERAGVNLALNMAQSPELLILDEPTLGLDIVAKQAFLESLLFAQQLSDMTIVYCSHHMEEVERVADNLFILEFGELKHASTPDDFRERVQYWVADFGQQRPQIEMPGLLQSRNIEGQEHIMVLDQDESFGAWLQSQGATFTQNVPISLEKAVNGFLSKNHISNQKQEVA